MPTVLRDNLGNLLTSAATHALPEERTASPNAAAFRQRFIRVASPLVMGILVISFLVIVGVDIMSSLRAAVTGEARYSKAQKTAVLALHRYARTGQEEDFLAFNRSLSVNLGLVRSLEALRENPPDMKSAYDGMIIAQLQAADIPGLLRLFTAFSSLPEVSNAMADWGEANGIVLNIQQEADRLLRLVRAGKRNGPEVDALLNGIDNEDARLQVLEASFSERLGVTSRGVNSVRMYSLTVVSTLFMALVLLAWTRLLRRDERQRLALERSRAGFQFLANHDELTGLVNRRHFAELLEKALRAAPDENGRFALLYIDLDQFKVINDTSGHPAGDALLKQVAGILRTCLATDHVLARMGGDEFGVLLSRTSRQEALAEGLKIVSAVNGIVYSWQGRPYRTSASIGLVMFDDVEPTLASLLGAADAACIVAKDVGRNRVHAFHVDDQAVGERRSEMEWVSRVRQALQTDQLHLCAQPVHAIAQPERFGFSAEVLVRLSGRDGTLIRPGAFLPAANRYGLMADVDRWVIRHGLRGIARWQLAHPEFEETHFSINLSSTSAADPMIPAYVAQELRDSGIAAHLIAFEITETDAVSSLSEASQVMQALRELGCQVALDDFGAGISSWTYLRHLPVDYLKIDGALVRGIAHDEISRSMVKAIHDVAKTMGKPTVAEYVDNEEILTVLRELGIEFAQGDAVGKEFRLH